MGYPPPPPPPGSPGGYPPPSGPPGAPPPGGYGPPTGAPGYGPPPGAPGTPGPGYGPPPGPGGYGPPTGPPGYGGPPPGGPPGAGGSSGGSSKGPLIALMVALVVVALLVGIGVVVLALGGDDGGDVELTEDQLRDALVTQEDVGADYVEDTDEAPDDDDEFDIDELDASEECLDLFVELEASGALGDGSDADVSATVQFDGPSDEQVEETLSQGGATDLDTIREFVDTCDEIAVDDGESVGTLSFEIVDDVAEVGDDRLTLRLEVDLDEPIDITVPTLGVLWERDGTHGTVNISGAVDPETFVAGEPDEALLADVVERADERLAEAIEGA